MLPKITNWYAEGTDFTWLRPFAGGCSPIVNNTPFKAEINRSLPFLVLIELSILKIPLSALIKTMILFTWCESTYLCPFTPKAFG